jgi:hypothetical protein
VSTMPYDLLVSRPIHRRSRGLYDCDCDIVSPAIECHADKVGSRRFIFDAFEARVTVLAFNQSEAVELFAPTLKELRHLAQIRANGCDDLEDDVEFECWCGEKGKPSELFDDSGLDVTCGGLGVLTCRCGGDLCVCHYHGETDCLGCPECEGADDDDFDDEP